MRPRIIFTGALAGLLGPLLWFHWKGQQQRSFLRGLLGAHAGAPDDRRVIVSLSTLPDRIAQLEPTLRCLLAQTRPPDEIVLALPDFSQRQQRGYELPEFLHAIPQLHVLRCGRDWGPATKFIPAIQRELAAGRGDTLIMVVDDDRVYPRDALETYAHFERLLPEAALCFRGATMPRNLDWRDSRMTRANCIREPRPMAVITGCGSYLLKPRFFDASLWDYRAAPPAAFFMDDIWVSGCLDRRGVEKFVVPGSGHMRSVRAQRRTMTLADVPDGRQNNNNEVIRHFAGDWKVFAAR